MKARGEGKIKIDKGVEDGYRYYKKSIADKPDDYKISRSIYGKIIKDIHKEISRKILEESGSFRMPCGLPSVRIKKYKRQVRFREDGSIDPKSLAVNWKATRELWDKNEEAKKKKKLVYFINDHSDGYSATFILEKYAANVPNLSLYRFKCTRSNDRRLGEIMLDPYNKIDYYA